MGADHHGYINRLKASLETFGVDSDRLEIQIMQMVRLMQNGEEVKMVSVQAMRLLYVKLWMKSVSMLHVIS